MTLRSHLLPRVEVGPHDALIVKLLATLPAQPPSSSRHAEKVGITNARGRAYRVIEVLTAFELLQVTARLNSISYRVDGQARSHYPAYARVFSRR